MTAHPEIKEPAMAGGEPVTMAHFDEAMSGLRREITAGDSRAIERLEAYIAAHAAEHRHIDAAFIEMKALIRDGFGDLKTEVRGLRERSDTYERKNSTTLDRRQGQFDILRYFPLAILAVVQSLMVWMIVELASR